MGHFITGIIVSDKDIESFVEMIPFKQFHKLNQGFVFFPLTDDLIDKFITVPQTFNIKEFTYLSKKLENMLSRASAEKFVTYIETEYFGGEGSQSAILFKNGIVASSPKQGDVGTINDVLRIIGVIKEPEMYDEFESLGLASFRSSEKLLEDMQNHS